MSCGIARQSREWAGYLRRLQIGGKNPGGKMGLSHVFAASCGEAGRDGSDSAPGSLAGLEGAARPLNAPGPIFESALTSTSLFVHDLKHYAAADVASVNAAAFRSPVKVTRTIKCKAAVRSAAVRPAAKVIDLGFLPAAVCVRGQLESSSGKRPVVRISGSRTIKIAV